MDQGFRATVPDSELTAQSGVAWAAIAAGAVTAAALTLVFVAFGAGLGLSAISPWSDSFLRQPLCYPLTILLQLQSLD
jgi:hypothetical protein